MPFNIIPCYFILDFCAVFMTEDPYFILGPNDLPLPSHLASLHPILLSLRRTALSFVALLCALQMVWNFGALCLAFLCPPILGLRAHPWHLPTMYGSFTEVLDRGLAGFWGAWWHQTFRFGFAAPSRWLLRNGYIEKGTPLASFASAFVAFALSGFLHASGSYSTVPDHSKWWNPPLFFLFSAAGSVLQQYLARALRPWIVRMPRPVRRAGNLLFVAVWLHMTSWALFDDFGRCGLWLFEPVPVSLFRYLGIGNPHDRRIWRYDRDFFPQWYKGKHWWDSGLGI
jgi:hypothetical protein